MNVVQWKVLRRSQLVFGEKRVARARNFYIWAVLVLGCCLWRKYDDIGCHWWRDASWKLHTGIVFKGMLFSWHCDYPERNNPEATSSFNISDGGRRALRGRFCTTDSNGNDFMNVLKAIKNHFLCSSVRAEWITSYTRSCSSLSGHRHEEILQVSIFAQERSKRRHHNHKENCGRREERSWREEKNWRPEKRNWRQEASRRETRREESSRCWSKGIEMSNEASKTFVRNQSLGCFSFRCAKRERTTYVPQNVI